MMTLDVGCGNRPRGIVNLDYRKDWNPEIEQKEGRGILVDTKSILNFVLGDALHLPFRDKSFGKVTCFHVIEHVQNPYLLIQELLRVSNGEVEIRCPHRFSKHAKMPYHRHYFTRSWFAEALKGHSYGIKLTHWSPLREMFGLIRLPHEVRVRIEMNRKIQDDELNPP